MSAPLAAGLLLAAGCGRVPARHGGPVYFGSTTPPRDNVFRFNNQAEPENLDPGLMSGQPDGRVAKILFEGLVVPNPRTLDPEAGQAHSWDIAPDGRTYTFHLRGNLRWSDGTALTSRDFYWSWMRVLRPSTGARYAALLYAIRGAEDYNKGREPDSSKVGLRTPDDSTFVVELESPTPYFLFQTMFYTFLPVPRGAVERWGDRWILPSHIVTNGPFLLKQWRQGDRFVFTKNPGYWDAARVQLDGIECYPVDNVSSSVNLYKSGAVDWNPSGGIPTPFLPYMRGFSDLVSGSFQATYFYSINCTRKPFDDPRVRLALNYAIDRGAIASKLLKGTRDPWGSYCPRGYPGYKNLAGYGYDPARARRLLAEAGFPGGKGMRKIQILFNTSEDHRRIAEAIQGMWQKELGIEVELDNQEWGSYLEASTKLRYDVARRSWIGDYPDPYTFLSIMAAGDGNNRTGWSDGEYDRLMHESTREADAGRRLALLRRAEEIIVARGPLIPIYHYVTYEQIKPYMRGLYQNPLDQHDLKFVSIHHGWKPGMPVPGRH